MKQRYFFILLLCSAKLAAQTPVEVSYQTYPITVLIDFESPGDSQYVLHDTAATPLQLWQVGHPQKTTFANAIGGQRAVVTDTLNTYPINSHASVTFKVINYLPCIATLIQFNCQLNTTPLQDGGMIEISHNNGSTWYNVCNDPFLMSGAPYTTTDTVAALGQPGFSGNVSNVVSLVYNAVNYSTADTFLVRMAFASDSTAEALDGWMVDDLFAYAECEGVPEYVTALPLDFGPNPTTGKIFLRSSAADKFDVEVRDQLGRLIVRETSTGMLDFSALPSGCYFLHVRSGNQIARKTLAIAH